MADIWPILETAGRPPDGWQGWPEGKHFSLVLTHDVETQAGHDKCRRVMDLEESLGFRSLFNFVPERYNVSPELRREMAARGFEIGVHGLVHDGRLFASRRTFEARTPRINDYLRMWKAEGFRSPSMRRNLQWIGELDIEYDLSTFDTDPFEPESSGVRTIFPFVITDPSTGKSYVELPYTLPQDSTLFVIFCQHSSTIWKKKVDWIAAKGGMALINTHPDYMACDERLPKSHMLYPAVFYGRFLQYVRDRYGESMWHALPRQVSRYCRSVHEAGVRVSPKGSREPAAQMPQISTALPSLTGKRVLMIVFSVYPGDPRVRRAAEAVIEAGGHVDVLCLEHDGAPKVESVRGVNVIRAPVRRMRARKGRYMMEYISFWTWALGHAATQQFKRRYSVVHVHNMPDFLVFSAIIPKLCGAKIILDLHDPMPEMYMTKYSVQYEDRQIRLLRYLEKKSISFADLGITPNIAFRNLFVQRSCLSEKMHIVMNSPQETLFRIDEDAETRTMKRYDGQFRLMYHGLIVERHGLDTAVRAVAKLREHVPGISFNVFGPGDSFVDRFVKLVDELAVGDLVTYHGPVPLEEISRRVHNADLGIIPNRRSPFTEINFPTRIFEYLSVAKPLVVPRTRGIQDYFDESSILYFNANDIDDLARVIVYAYEHPDEMAEMVKRGREIYNRHRWSIQKRQYVDLVRDLVTAEN